MIPEYLDKNCMVYMKDAVTFLDALAPESVQLIWTRPPYDDQQSAGPLKTVAQMEFVELCAELADVASRVLTSSGVLAINLPSRYGAGVVAAITKRTLLTIGSIDWDLEDESDETMLFDKGNPLVNNYGLSSMTHTELDDIISYVMAHTNEGDMVVDPFCGSGDVMEAAVLVGRVAVVNDKNPEAVAATIHRYKERFAR